MDASFVSFSITYDTRFGIVLWGVSQGKECSFYNDVFFICLGLVSVIWVLWGYSLAFGAGGNAFIGSLNNLALSGVDTPEDQVFAVFQMMFAIITPALITGAFCERFKFKTYLVFLVL